MEQIWTVRRLRTWIVGYLTARSVDSPAICADLLLAHVLRCDRMRIYMDIDRPANPEELLALRGLVQRAGQHEPVQYLVGTWSFFGCEIEVTPATLIPRQATESLVEEVLRRIRSTPRVEASCEVRIADLCTGSGCIAIAIARSLMAERGGRKRLSWQRASEAQTEVSAIPDLGVRIYATELVAAAAELARKNVKALGLEASVEVLEGDLDAPLCGRELEGTFDVVCANPPYISDAEWEVVPTNVKQFEPATALRGGSDGLDFVRRIVSSAPRWLRIGGSLVVEISSSQGAAATALARDHGYGSVQVLSDLEGHPRILAAIREK